MVEGAGITHITKPEELDKIVKQNKYVVVDMFATWCGPCRMQKPILEEFAVENLDVRVVGVDTDKAQELSTQYNIMSIPTLLFFANGALKQTKIGLTRKDDLKKIVDSMKTGTDDGKNRKPKK